MMYDFFFFSGIYFLIINVVSFAAYGIDKSKAKNGEWRIPEATLLLMGFIGGAIGSFAGMKIFHHKTKKAKFRILVPVFMVLNVAAVVFAVYLKVTLF